VPVLILQENNCSQHSTTSRREILLRTESVPMAAWRRGPNALWATLLGSSARRRSPQPGQRTRWHWCSVTATEIAGSSSTCQRTGSPTATCSSTTKAWPQPHNARPMLDHPVHRPHRQQRPAPALMSRLGALLATRWILAALRRASRRIGARGNGGVARAAVQSAPELVDALILAGDTHGQRLDLSVHPQQHLHDRHAPSVIDRLRLNPVHTTGFDTADPYPPTN
jgi:hypothetical protein